MRGFLVIVVLSLTWLSCSQEPDAGPPRPDSPPNIVLLSLDTLRADHMACYGYGLPNTPQLDRFLEGATLYRNAQATAPWTLPSHASMFTGLYPSQHGARTFHIETFQRNVSSLEEDQTTLTELLRLQGYRTQAYVANKHYLSPNFGVSQGFDGYRLFRKGDLKRAEEMAREYLPWLERQGEQPFFLFINYMDTHRPYNSKGGERLFDFEVGSDSGQILNRSMEPVLTGNGQTPEVLADLRQLRAQYDTSVLNLDAELGRLFDKLKELGLYEDCLILITSDHGEYFGEHDLLEHSKDVYQGALWVPLLMKSPGQTVAETVHDPISIAAIPYLISDRLPASTATAIEASLPPRANSQLLLAENYYARNRQLFDQPWGDRFHRVRRSLIADGWKLIAGDDGSHELYNLAEDPEELVDRWDAETEIGAALERKLLQYLEDTELEGLSASGLEFNEEDMRILDELGY